jgi:outer membrane protein TolC
MKHIQKILILFLVWIFFLANLGIDLAWAQDNPSLPLEEQHLSLDDCIKLAIEHSFEVKLARLDFLIAQTDKGVAEAIYDTILSAEISYEKDKRATLSSLGSSFSRTNIYSVEAEKELPSGTTVTLALSDTRDWSDSLYVSANPAHTAEAELELRQPLGKNRFGYIDQRDISVTSLSIQNADLNTKERIESLLAQVEAAYWEWALYKRSLEIHRQILEKAGVLHQTNAKNLDLGRIERGDFLASEANVLLREKDIMIAENNYRRAEEKIKLLINIEANLRIHPAQALEYKNIEIDLEDCFNQALQERRDYQKAKREVEMKELILETKTNARWPEIDLVASLSANGIDSDFGRAFNNITTDDNKKYYAGLEISIPIENTEAKSEFKKATHKKEKTLLNLKNIERAIVTEVGNYFRDYVTYEVNFTKIKKAAGLQRGKLKEEEKRFEYGRSNTKRLIDYQQDYLRAELQVAQALADLEVARINLEKSLNNILKKYERLL